MDTKSFRIWRADREHRLLLARNPVPPELVTEARLEGFPGVRCWEVDYKPDIQMDADDQSSCNFLAVSGGGSNGAFGAGILNGWAESGTRPDFKIVTGISTGALIAPGAFLGAVGDKIVKDVYTTVGVKDIYNVRGLGVMPLVLGESYASVKPLQNLLANLVNHDILKDIASEHAKGKRLYIGTTNLDAQRIVAWDMGAIASSGHPDALNLFHKVMLASAAIPGMFPPVHFEVEVDGKKYDEMHVDGSLIAGVVSYGVRLFEDESDVPEQDSNCNLYMIINKKLASEAHPVSRRVTKIFARTVETMMKSMAWWNLYRIYSLARRDKVSFNYVCIPDDYEALSNKMFNHAEMMNLYNLGFEMARSGDIWRNSLPGFGEVKEKKWVWTPIKK